MNFFAYGTLLVPKIWEAVTGESETDRCEAHLSGYQIFRVKEGDFPGIVETEDETDRVPGQLFSNISLQTLSALDRYEDTFYERVEVRVKTAEGFQFAETYRIPNSTAAQVLTPDSWSLEWFESEALDQYWSRIFA
jgi:gamma-glutamylcyclotransferase (GGCT)/AIG2-like uncharacterized protein YtfP